MNKEEELSGIGCLMWIIGVLLVWWGVWICVSDHKQAREQCYSKKCPTGYKTELLGIVDTRCACLLVPEEEPK
jgi:hypothetical protein